MAKSSETFDAKRAEKTLLAHRAVLMRLAEVVCQITKPSKKTAFRLGSMTVVRGSYDDDGSPFTRILVTDERFTGSGSNEVWQPGFFTDFHVEGRVSQKLAPDMASELAALSRELPENVPVSLTSLGYASQQAVMPPPYCEVA